MTIKKSAPKETIQALTNLYRQRKFKQLNACMPKLLDKYKDRYLMKIAIHTLKDQNKSISQLCRRAYKQFHDEWFLIMMNPSHKLSADCWYEICHYLSIQDLSHLRQSCQSLNNILNQGIFYRRVECSKKTDKQLIHPFKRRQDVRHLILSKCNLAGSNNLSNLTTLSLTKCDISMKTTSRMVEHATNLKYLKLIEMPIYATCLNNLKLTELYLDQCCIAFPVEDTNISFDCNTIISIQSPLHFLKHANGVQHLNLRNSAIFGTNIMLAMDLISLVIINVQFEDKNDFYNNLSQTFPNLQIVKILDVAFNKMHLVNMKSLDLIELHLYQADLSLPIEKLYFPNLTKLTLRDCHLYENIPIRGPLQFMDFGLNKELVAYSFVNYVKQIAYANKKKLQKLDVTGCISIQQHHLTHLAQLTDLLDVTDLQLPVNFYHELKRITKMIWKRTQNDIIDRVNAGRDINRQQRP